MKKILSIISVVVMVAALAVGCAPKAAPAAAEPAPTPAVTEAPAATPAAAEAPAFKDGTYTAKGKTDERGWTPEIEVTVKDGKVTAVKYDEISADNKKKTEDAEYKDAFMKNKNVDLIAAYEALQNSLVEKQDPSKVDAYSGASSTSGIFVELAAKALEQAK